MQPPPPERPQLDPPKQVIGVGMPAFLMLEQFGAHVREAFPGCDAYLVGSASVSKTWRDVDVRCLLTERQYRRYVGEPGGRLTLIEPAPDAERQFTPYYSEEAHAASWPVGLRRTALTIAFCALARQMTGLPVDFQFQTYQYANAYFHSKLVAPGSRRIPLGLAGTRLAR